MVTIQDHSGFKITIRPEYSNWWSFYFDFTYNDKPLFNPEIVREGGIKGDEYESWPFLPVLVEALDCRTDGKTFQWGAWEEEVSVEISASMKNLDKGEDGIFEFAVFSSEQNFIDGEVDYGFQHTGAKIFLNREELKKVYQDLKQEMAEIARKEIKELTPKGEGYEGHVKFLSQYLD